MLWKAEEKWKTRGCGLAFGGTFHDEYMFRGMMWADNYGLSSDDKDKLVCMVNDSIEELPDLDVGPKLGVVMVDEHLQKG